MHKIKGVVSNQNYLDMPGASNFFQEMRMNAHKSQQPSIVWEGNFKHIDEQMETHIIIIVFHLFIEMVAAHTHVNQWTETQYNAIT